MLDNQGGFIGVKTTPALNGVTKVCAGDSAVVYCQDNFGKMDGKTANGLVRFSEKYQIAGVIDGAFAGKDAGEVLDGEKNGIPIYFDLEQALEKLSAPPKYFIYGMAPLTGFLSAEEKQIIFHAMDRGLDIVNGLHEYLNDDVEYAKKASDCGVKIFDIRKPKAKKDLSLFTGRIAEVLCPKIAVLGTDSAIGKRTTSTILTQALNDVGLKALMVATGQTGLIQGAKYGVALDAIPEQFISGEMEAAVVSAYEGEGPDVIIIEGQGALSHPAYLSSCFIIRGSRPEAIVLQHAPGRKMLGDYPKIPMPTIESEVELVETFADANVIAVAINHENMSPSEVEDVAKKYEEEFDVAAMDVLAVGADGLVDKILETFPELKKKIKAGTDADAAAPN